MIAFIGRLTTRAREQARRRLLHLRRSEDGQALVELALVLPVLLIVVLAIVDFGRAVNYWNDENHLAEIGARYAAVGSLPTLPTTDPCFGQESSLPTYLECEAGIDSPELESGSNATTGVHGYPNGNAAGVNNGLTGVCVSVPNNAAGQEVTVQVAVEYNWFPVPKVLGGSGSFSNVSLKGTATMRLEAPMPSNWITTAGTCT
jgi:Flp pilus assembly protein TadG